MRPANIIPGIDWVGSLDPDLRVFDVIMRADRGTTYNSYLVRGSSKTALIETSKATFADSYLETLRQAIDPKEIDYIILNHMEPDHSGALAAVLDAAPRARVFLTRAGLTFARNVANRDFDSHVVSDNETLDLGGRTLRFLITPFIHWPDTMITHLEPDGLLFPCDFLGAHYCDERLFDDLLPDYGGEFHYYFQAIMRPFKEHVRYALDRIAGLDVKMVCPSHGPILRKNPKGYLDLYRQWSAAPARRDKKLLLVFYASAYGATKAMAEAIARGAEDSGAEAKTFDLSVTGPGAVLDEIELADGIAVGSCTINGDALEQAWGLLSSLATLNVKKKLGASFGSFGWSGEGPKMLAERLKGLKFRVPEEPARVQLMPTPDDLEMCRAYGERLAGQL